MGLKYIAVNISDECNSHKHDFKLYYIKYDEYDKSNCIALRPVVIKICRIIKIQ